MLRVAAKFIRFAVCGLVLFAPAFEIFENFTQNHVRMVLVEGGRGAGETKFHASF
jgi:hypothetical protein